MKFKLHKGQLEVAQDQHRFKIINAGRRWGKSKLSQLIIFQWAVQTPGLYWVVSPTYVQGKTIHWLGLLQIIPQEYIYKKNEAELTITLKNGSVISLKSADNPDSLRGSGLRGLVVDEIASIRDWVYLWEQALRPALSDFQGKVVFISTPQGFNHFYELFMQGKSDDPKYKDYMSWHFTSYDNPYIKKEEIDDAKNELTEDAFATEYMADFRKFTGLVYKEFDRKKHVLEMEFVPRFYIRGLDRGYSVPTAVPVIAVDKEDVWYQLDEIYQTNLTNVALWEVLEEKRKEYSIEEFELSTMDSAQIGDLIELNQMGADFIPVQKESGESRLNYVNYKIQKLAQRIKDGKFFINPKCVNTIFEFEHYEWQQKKILGETNFVTENPLKLNDHMMDALGDLNSMYLHTFDRVKKPWEDKIPGTYIEPSVKDEDENEWNAEVKFEEDEY